MTQGELVSPIVFNIMVNAVVRAVIVEVCGLKEAHQGIWWVTVKHNIVFYADDGYIVGRNPIWV